MADNNPFRLRVASPGRGPEASPSNTVKPIGAPPPIPPRPSSPPGVPGTERDVPESDSGSSRGPSPARQSPRNSPPLPPLPPQAELQELLRGESPPPYTPAPDVYHGESTVELGPRRPFAQAPAPSRNAAPPWQRSQPRQQPQWPPANWSQFPGSGVSRTATGSTYRRTVVAAPPPPQHPQSPTHNRSAGSFSAPAPPQPASDFARDFYAAGAADDGLLGGSSAQYAPPPDAPSPSPYAPPPGPPPGHMPNGRPATPPRPANGGRGQSDVSDDGRPTMKPVPGHPLMNNGRVLVYPSGYECNKCRNTGYKHLDPSNPCTKCWSKFAKPFAGPLTYAPWGTPSANGSNFQQPLPALPHSPANPANASQRRFTPPPQHASLSRSATTSRVSGYPGGAAQPSGIPLANGGFLPTSGYASPFHSASQSPLSGPSAQYARSPPAGATIVRPGDPRIGGQLCWRCGGRGSTAFFIFDDTCNVCNGVGRTFP